MADGAGKNYLVVVGSLHLVGPDSLVQLLDARGFTVKRLGASSNAITP